jgi:hypothetical protein
LWFLVASAGSSRSSQGGFLPPLTSRLGAFFWFVAGFQERVSDIVEKHVAAIWLVPDLYIRQQSASATGDQGGHRRNLDRQNRREVRPCQDAMLARNIRDYDLFSDQNTAAGLALYFPLERRLARH